MIDIMLKLSNCVNQDFDAIHSWQPGSEFDCRNPDLTAVLIYIHERHFTPITGLPATRLNTYVCIRKCTDTDNANSELNRSRIVALLAL
jgi:hypothetical protein